MRAPHEPARVAVMLYDGVEPIDIGATVGVVSMASRLLPGISAVTVARTTGPIRCAGGLVVLAAYGFADLPPCDALIVTGGPGWPAVAADADSLAFLRAWDPARLASVCTGALILGAAGLLRGRPATTRRLALGNETQSPLALLARDGALPEPAQLIDPPGGPLTGGGVSLAHDLTLHLVGRLYGDDAANRVAAAIEYDRALAANRAALGRGALP